MDADRVHGWLLLHSDDMPDSWRNRAERVLLVPLLAEETAEILAEGHARSAIAPEEERLAVLVARGCTTRTIAVQLRLSPRTVERRIASLRKRLQVATRSELQVALARLGF